MKRMKWNQLLAAFLCLCLAGMAPAWAEEPAAVSIELGETIRVNGAPITQDETCAVYAANDIVYYEAGHDFTYGEGTEADAHTPEEAAAHTVVHITRPGTYEVSGTLPKGQIAVDLGSDAKKDPQAVVTLILNNVDITCDVAPAIIFYKVYECGDKDEDTAVKDVNTAGAGANIILAEGSVNHIAGSYVARIYDPETVELNEDKTEVEDAKKLHKYDGAVYSRMSMNLDGSGVLNVKAANEGIDTELHLTINGGEWNITSGNDGINTNEDNVSVTTVNGGKVHITVDGSTGEGDGIDSNGWLVINGGEVIAESCAFSGDAGIDADKGVYVMGGNVTATGNMYDHIADESTTHVVFTFASRQQGGQTYTLKNAQSETVAQWTPANAFTYLVATWEGIAPGEYTLWQGETQLAGASTEMRGRMPMGGFGGGMPEMGQPPELPEGMEMPEDLEPGQMPEGMTPPELPEGMAFPEGIKDPEGAEPGQLPEMPAEGATPPAMPEGADFRRGGGRGWGGKGGRGQGTEGSLSTTFVIQEGANAFGSVAAAQTK